MARTEARIKTSIWNDKDFLALSADAKLLYLHTTTQATVNLCGVIAKTPGSWSNALALPRKRLDVALKELEDSRFYVVDDHTEEVLHRTFVRHDGVLTKPNVIIAMTKEWLTIRSDALRETVLDEIPEGFFEGLPERFPKVFGEGFPEQFPEGFQERLGEPSHVRSSTSTSTSANHPLIPTADAVGTPSNDEKVPGNSRAHGTNPRAIAAKRSEVESRRSHFEGIKVWASNRQNMSADVYEAAARECFSNPDEFEHAMEFCPAGAVTA